MSTPAFRDLGISPVLLKTLDALDFHTPTPIQERAIPLGLAGRDLIGIAQTGTGKTLAFGLPLLQRLAESQRAGLILVPTRELALQVDEALRRLAPAVGLRSAVLIGGESMQPQTQRLRANPHVVIATPGRLNDHLDRRQLRLDRVGILILDEADRMLDMGFYPQIERVLKEVPRDRQTLLFSATWPTAIQGLAAAHLNEPVTIEVARSGSAATTVSQSLFVVPRERKADLLGRLLRDHEGSVLLFVRTKRSAQRVAEGLRDLGHAATEIHADRTLGQRRNALRGFKSGQFRVLVATDIAARGLDVHDIGLVVNYDLPDDPENYVHRIGRTGRAGRSGRAITLATPDQGAELRQIERLLRVAIPRAEHPEVPAARLTLELPPRRHSGSGSPYRGARPGASRPAARTFGSGSSRRPANRGYRGHPQPRG